jgi:GNAT superfamily N-acetyltransferase
VTAVAVPAGLVDIEPLSDALQAAFWDDPVMAWLTPKEKTRSRHLGKMFNVLLTVHYLPMRTVWTTSDTLGAALWAPPGHWRMNYFDMFRAAPIFSIALGSRVLPAKRFLIEVDEHHPKEPHWYLGVLGTSPAHQGKGVGSAVLQPVLEHCDEAGLPAYLESSKEANIPFYNRHGFAVTREFKAPRDGPTVWAMWRPPQG